MSPIFIKYDKANSEWDFSNNKKDILFSIVDSVFYTAENYEEIMEENNLVFSSQWFEIDQESSPLIFNKIEGSY